ncbi:hypothetical protein [Agarivorans aestuarii]|uniref:hypothetical protein n=1 Tax=Agarivorans aestuarii TaxID=1563703 RepID=UPI001C7F2653|nr:hypothetical protein [Agarivorans aestuarii]
MIKSWYHLFIALSFSLCVNMVSADEYLTYSEASFSDEVQFVLDSPDSSAKKSAPLSNQPAPILDTTSSHYFLSLSRKLVSTDKCADQGLKPEYFLLIAFLSPPLLDMATQAQRPPTTQEHWASHFNYSRSRLSGWKEANTLYSQGHIRPS